MIVEPGAGSRPLVRAIDRADHTVFADIYILSDPRIVHALERAAAQGVAVYALLDPHPYGLSPQMSSIGDVLRAAGLHVRAAPPGFAFNHVKLLVLDDRIAFVSSANFSRSAFRANREFIVRTADRRDVRTLSALFRDDWDRLPANIRDPSLVVSPLNARAKLTALLDAARRTVDIYAEEIADPRVETLLATLARRGVRVRLLLPASSPDAQRLVARSVAVRTLDSPYVHAKAIVVDRREAFVGSENLSTTSLDHNREVGILLRGAGVAAVESTFARDWERAVSVGRVPAADRR